MTGARDPARVRRHCGCLWHLHQLRHGLQRQTQCLGGHWLSPLVGEDVCGAWLRRSRQFTVQAHLAMKAIGGRHPARTRERQLSDAPVGLLVFPGAEPEGDPTRGGLHLGPSHASRCKAPQHEQRHGEGGLTWIHQAAGVQCALPQAPRHGLQHAQRYLDGLRRWPAILLQCPCTQSFSLLHLLRDLNLLVDLAFPRRQVVCRRRDALSGECRRDSGDAVDGEPLLQHHSG